MKVDAKITQEKVKDGLFSSKMVHKLNISIQYTDVEIATITKAGLGDFIFMSQELSPADQKLLHQTHWEYAVFDKFGKPFKGASSNHGTLIQAQVALQDTKRRLTELKRLMETSQTVGAEDSFEL